MAVEGDIVLIHYQDQPAAFARIELIEPDVKKGWYQVTLLLLTIPTRTVTWILRDAYIEGEPFTMGGKPVKLEEVKRVSVPGEPGESVDREDGKAPGQGKAGTIIPFKKR